MLRLLTDRIAVIPIEDPEKIGSIIVPKESKRRSDQGIIKYRGDGVKELKIGDHVLFSAYSGSQLMLEGEGKLIILQEDDIIAIMTGGETNVLYTRHQVETFMLNAVKELAGTGVDVEYYEELLERFSAQIDSHELVRV